MCMYLASYALPFNHHVSWLSRVRHQNGRYSSIALEAAAYRDDVRRWSTIPRGDISARDISEPLPSRKRGLGERFVWVNKRDRITARRRITTLLLPRYYPATSVRTRLMPCVSCVAHSNVALTALYFIMKAGAKYTRSSSAMDADRLCKSPFSKFVRCVTV